MARVRTSQSKVTRVQNCFLDVGGSDNLRARVPADNPSYKNLIFHRIRRPNGVAAGAVQGQISASTWDANQNFHIVFHRQVTG